jgi:hypothetical protein
MDLPAHAVLDTVTRMDTALRRRVNERKAGRQLRFSQGQEEIRQRKRHLLPRAGDCDHLKREYWRMWHDHESQ